MVILEIPPCLVHMTRGANRSPLLPDPIMSQHRIFFGQRTLSQSLCQVLVLTPAYLEVDLGDHNPVSWKTVELHLTSQCPAS